MDEKIAWLADEYKRHDHDPGWYAGLFLVGILLVAWGLYSNNVIATILFVLVVFTIYALSHREPNKVMVELNRKGIVINDRLFPYKELKYFWIFEDDDYARLELETKAIVHRRLSIELEDQDPDIIRDYLNDFVEELEDHEENFVDFLMRKFKI